jgi:hypothetical protein
MKIKLFILIVILFCISLVVSNLTYEETANKKLAVQKNKEKTLTVQVNGVTHNFTYNSEQTKDQIKATMTTEGIVWVPDPMMTNASNVLDKLPKEPFKLYLNKKRNSTVRINNSENIYSLPLKDGKGNFVFLESLFGVGNHVIFTTYMKKKGMNQPIENKMYDLVLDSKKASLITSYEEFGGLIFDFGINKKTKDIVYIQTSPDGDNYKRIAGIYHIATGEIEKLDKFKVADKKITYSIRGEEVSINDLAYP